MFWGLFIFRRHSPREAASSGVTYFIPQAYAGTGVSHSQHREKIRGDFGEKKKKNAGEWNRRVEISKEEILGSNQSMHGYILTYTGL